MLDTNQPLWTPPQNRVASAAMTAFMAQASARAGRQFATYDQLWRWSTTEIESFWELVWQESNVVASSPYSCVLEKRVMPNASWFTGAKLNFAENLLRCTDNRPAIIAWSECRAPITLSFADLREQVRLAAAGLRRCGVQRGDRVAAYMPNVPETVVAMLATTSIGAIWSSCSPDFGLQGVIDRFSQIEPKVLITTDGYSYHGKIHSVQHRLTELLPMLPSVTTTVVAAHDDSFADNLPGQVITWGQLTAPADDPLTFEQLPFHHPVYILYSSGTTGKPKCIVHGAGGTLLQHWKEHRLHTDLTASDLLFFYTTCGWMMWNWLVSALQIGTPIFLYEGSPTYPKADILFDAVDQLGITVFGTSPKFLTHCQQSGLRPRSSHRLTSLRSVLSTGSPLSAENFRYVYSEIKSDLCLSSISGGTDIVSCFMLGNPSLPVYAEEIQCRGLGMAVAAWDDSGNEIVDAVGELVCTQPAPSMPVAFWNDSDGEAYRKAYFDHFSGIWRHGDYIKITDRGGVIVYGRSDATLNPAGVRIGTAEIYNPLELIPEIVDSLVIGQKWKDDIRVVLFVVLRDDLVLADDLRLRIREAIRKRTTSRHVPALILQIAEVPRTLNGKKVELAVSRIIHGEVVTNQESLMNPASLAQFEKLRSALHQHGA